MFLYDVMFFMMNGINFNFNFNFNSRVDKGNRVQMYNWAQVFLG